jgi:hypothetical protein
VTRLWISFNFNKKKAVKPKEDKRKFVEPLSTEEVVWEQ